MQNRKVVIFYGSQTGTAEDYAQRMAKEIKKRYGQNPLVYDLEVVDMKFLDQVPEDALALFVMATYGEGEPTDNAQAFWDLLQEDEPEFSEQHSLEHLRYCVFGLGNRTYEYFNQAAKVVDEKLAAAGATRLGERGEGDDDGSLEDDFVNWQEGMWPILAENLEAGEDAGETATWVVDELVEGDEAVYFGELGNKAQSSFDAKKPFPAPIVSRDLLRGCDRHCLHIDIDIAGSGLSYTTGDHVAIWPSNNDVEIMRLAAAVGLSNKLDTPISVRAADPSAAKQSPFPTPTTYRAALRHYLDICQPPSRQALQALLPFCDSPSLQKIVDDKEEHKRVVLDAVRNLAEVFEYCEIQPAIPAPILIECFSRLQPRYYSISSSSSESPNTVSVTAVTLQYNPEPTPERTVYGVNTNYLWAVHSAVHPSSDNPSEGPTYDIQGPHGEYFDKDTREARLPVHIRASTFRLPSAEKPVIMIGPGTGVAPFRGFVRERAFQKKQGQKVGTTVLFFGSRRSDQDYLYADEWPELFSTLGGQSRIITAFSRETEHKVYVQHRLKENAAEMWDLIYNAGASVYVCGDAKRMAKDVNNAIVDFAKDMGGMDETAAVEYVSNLRRNGRYQEDVWA